MFPRVEKYISPGKKNSNKKCCKSTSKLRPLFKGSKKKNDPQIPPLVGILTNFPGPGLLQEQTAPGVEQSIHHPKRSRLLSLSPGRFWEASTGGIFGKFLIPFFVNPKKNIYRIFCGVIMIIIYTMFYIVAFLNGCMNILYTVYIYISLALFFPLLTRHPKLQVSAADIEKPARHTTSQFH